MKQLLFTLTLGCFLTTYAQEKSNATDKRLAGLDSAFARILSVWKGPGFAVAVIEKNKIVYARGFGYRNQEEKLPVTPNTLFAIGSCTKAFTASLIGELTANDEIDIDKPVRDYLPELKFYNDDMNDRITTRDMMCHRTGLPRHDYSWYLFTTASRDSLVKRMQYLEPSAKVRDKWQYNNFMYLVQGYLIEKLTNQSWENNIRKNIFTPLVMSRSNTSVEQMEKDTDAAVGYEMKDSGKIRKPQKTDYYHIDAMGPAGGINSSISDMSKWLITWVYGGKYNGREIIPAAFAKEAMSSQMIVGAGFPETETRDLQFSNYGFGWGMSSYRGHYRVEHGGNIDGFSASTCFYPADSVGIVVLSNQGSSYIPAVVRNLITDKMFGLKYFDWNSYLWNIVEKGNSDQASAESAKVNVSKIHVVQSHPLGAYSGLFNNKGYGSMDIFLEHDSLFAGIGKNTAWLKQDQYEWFTLYRRDKQGRVDTSQGAAVEFRISPNGEINELNTTLEPSVKTLVFSRIVKPAAISSELMKKFEGEYEIGQMILKVFLKNNELHLTVPGQPEFTLIPIGENKFSLKDLNGYTISFNIDDKNDVTGLTSAQPNGTFKAIKKAKP